VLMPLNGRSLRPTAAAGYVPLPSLGEQSSGNVQLPHSNTLRAPFDNTESWLGGRERYVVGNYRLGEALEGERANLFGNDVSF